MKNTKMNPVVHFELPAKDNKRVSEFYTKVFGWKMQHTGPDMGNYILATTIESDENGPKKPGGINGGIFEYKDQEGFQYPSVVISVDNLKESIENVKKAGGKIVGLQMEIPGVGSFISFKDTEGNRIGMLQPVSQA